MTEVIVAIKSQRNESVLQHPEDNAGVLEMKCSLSDHRLTRKKRLSELRFKA